MTGSNGWHGSWRRSETGSDNVLSFTMVFRHPSWLSALTDNHLQECPLLWQTNTSVSARVVEYMHLDVFSLSKAIQHLYLVHRDLLI
jgi:hypothetical protein